jgi:hypothetical protein
MPIYTVKPIVNPETGACLSRVWDHARDKSYYHVVRAPDEQGARRKAASYAGPEGELPWLNARLSVCELLNRQSTVTAAEARRWLALRAHTPGAAHPIKPMER